MSTYVADTHALYWYLLASPRLRDLALEAFKEALAGAAEIHVPAIVLAELHFLNEKVGRPIDFGETFVRLSEARQFVLHPFEPTDVLDFDADSTVSEMHDRMIVGLARRLGAVLITRDTIIVGSAVVTTTW